MRRIIWTLVGLMAVAIALMMVIVPTSATQDSAPLMCRWLTFACR